jgi:hypothetical protein
VDNLEDRNSTCPYCSPVDHFQAALGFPPGKIVPVELRMYQKNWREVEGVVATKTRTVPAVERGDYWLVTLTSDDHLSKAFKGYTVEVLGRPYKHDPMAFAPLFGVTNIGTAGTRPWITFEACRVTSVEYPGEIRAHWHKGWQRIISIHQDIYHGPSDINMKMLEAVQRLFKYQDARGGGAKERFNHLDVTRAIQKLQQDRRENPPPITAELLATEMRRSAKRLNDWLVIEGETLEGLCEQARRHTEAMRWLEVLKHGT